MAGSEVHRGPLTHDLFLGPSKEQREHYRDIQAQKAKLAELEQENPLMAVALAEWTTAASNDRGPAGHLHALLTLEDELGYESEGLNKDDPEMIDQKPLTEMVKLLLLIESLQASLDDSLRVSSVSQEDLVTVA